jgi:hypothetical protein
MHQAMRSRVDPDRDSFCARRSGQVVRDRPVEGGKRPSMPQQQVAPADHLRELRRHLGLVPMRPEDNLLGDPLPERLKIRPAQYGPGLHLEPPDFVEHDRPERVVVAMQAVESQDILIESPRSASGRRRYDQVRDEPRQRAEDRVRAPSSDLSTASMLSGSSTSSVGAPKPRPEMTATVFARKWAKRRTGARPAFSRHNKATPSRLGDETSHD